MLILPAAAEQHLERQSRRLTVSGVIYKRDGTTIRCTQHDDDLEIEAGDLAGVYFSTIPITGSDIRSSSDLSVDNMEISGVINDALSFGGFSVQDIEAGLFDDAPFQTFICQWDDPNAWQKTMRYGYLGNIKRTAEGEFQCEWRGLVQLLQQAIGRTYGERCDVKRFGDHRCKLDVEALLVSGTVSAVTSRRRFDVTLIDLPPGTEAGYFDLGELHFATGLNVNFSKLVKRDAVNGTIGQFELWESAPYDVQVGDSVIIRPGCDRRFETCQLYGNYKNFRGHGLWIPGIPNIIRAP